MTHTSKTILFFGTDTFSAPTLEALIAHGYSVAAVITKPDSRAGRGQRLVAPIVKDIAERHGIAVWQPASLHDIADTITALQPVAGVLASYGKIIPQSILDLFEPGIINVHPSLLSRYRGPSPIEAALLNGDRQTGISIMRLEQKMDAGPLYGQTTVSLSGNETTASLYPLLAERGAGLLIDLLPSILDGSCQAEPQDESTASVTPMLQKTDGLLDPTRLSAAEAERRVRAYDLFPKTRLQINGHAVIVTKAHTSVIKTDGLAVVCRDGRYLVVDEVIAPSGRRMTGDAFLNGYAAGA
jgi:methionyl-tRNA formyltransferase